MSGSVTPVASCDVRYWASVVNGWSDGRRHTTDTVVSHRVSSLGGDGDELSLWGVNTMCPVSERSGKCVRGPQLFTNYFE